jgi:hypothetical protein
VQHDGPVYTHTDEHRQGCDRGPQRPVPPPAQCGTHQGEHKIDEKGAGGTFRKIDKKQEERQIKDVCGKSQATQ